MWLGGAQNNPPVEPRGGGPADSVVPQILEAESMVGTRALKELPILVPKIQEELPSQVLEAGSMARTRVLQSFLCGYPKRKWKLPSLVLGS